MTSDFELFSVILLLAAGQGLFLSLLLIFTKKGNWQANRYLGVFTLIVTVSLVDFSLDGIVSKETSLYLRTFLWPRDYLYGPVLYFYVREMTLPGKYSLLPRQWLHFLPAMLHAAFFWSLPFFSAQLHKAILLDDIELMPAFANVVENISNFEIITSILHVAIYLWLSMRLLKTHRKRIESTFSYNERISLNWLRNLLFGVIVVYLIWVFGDLFGELVDLSDVFYSLLGASMVLLIYTMSFLGLRQPVIFTNKAEQQVLTEEENAPQDKKKYKTSSLSDDLSQQLIDELQQLMSRDKPYLNSKLSLPELAEQLGVSANYLSQIINEQLEQNFFEFVNNYRVNDAKVLLSEVGGNKENILTIALDVGFNSKSSFYTAFKNHTGLTPGGYRKQLS